MEYITQHPIVAGTTAAIVALCGFRIYDAARLSVKPTDLTNKVVVITGGNRGIGKETVRHLAEHNATVIVGCRDVNTGKRLFSEIKSSGQAGTGELIIFKLDLSSFKSVREFADRVLALNNPINYLINNAGLIETDPKKLSEDGFSWMYQVNHLSHYLLTHLLLDNILRAAAFGDQARIINLSSGAQRLGRYDFNLFQSGRVRYGFLGYCDTKLMNVLFSNYLNHILEGKNVISVALHPGMVASEFGFNVSFIGRLFLTPIIYAFGRNERQGAMTTLFTVYSQNIEGGRYYESCALGKEQKNCKG